MLRLKQLRKEQKETQKQIADILGVTQATLSGWESGKYEIDNSSLVKLSRHFNVSTDYLLGNSDIKETDAKSSDMEESISEQELKVASKLYTMFVDSGVIRPGEDLTPKQFELLSGIINLFAKFHEEDQ